jgi:hypothetical protein
MKPTSGAGWLLSNVRLRRHVRPAVTESNVDGMISLRHLANDKTL